MLAYPAKIQLKEDDGKYYLVQFPDLEGCITEGDTIEEAKNNAKDALTGYLESIDLRSIKIPTPSKMKGKEIFYIEPEKNVEFAIILKLLRQKKGLSQKAIAKQLEISFQAYQKYENPVKANPTLKKIIKLEKIFGANLIEIGI